MTRPTATRAATLCLLLSAPLFAPTSSEAAENRNGFYSFVDYGRSDGSHSHDGSGLGYGAGWRHSNGLSVELQHVRNLFERVYYSEFINTGAGTGSARVGNELGAETTALMLGWTFPFANTPWSATAQIGGHKPDFDYPTDDAYPLNNDIRLAGGLRLSYAATQHWSISAALTHFDMKRFSDFDRTGLRVDYRF